MMTLTPATSTETTVASTVFIVDDDPAVRKALRWLMESVGMNVETYSSAAEFLSDFDPQRSGCIVSDVRMPGMGGLELQERLVERGCRLPMIIMTAYGDVSMAVRAMKSGAVHFFEKPINNQMLLDQIQLSLAEDLKRIAADARLQHSSERYARLTSREAQVLEEVVAGFSSKEIGKHLNVSFKTVEAHRAKIMRKMEADSTPHLIRMYLDIPPDQRVTQGKDDDSPE